MDARVNRRIKSGDAHDAERITLLDHVQNDGLLASDTLASTPSNEYGNDYIAGGAGDDEIFGGLGNDVIQGDGTIGMFAGATPYQLGQAQLSLQLASGGTYTLPAGFTTFGAARGGPVPTDPSNFGFSANFSGALTVNPSFEGAGDGNDYIEGGGGNDVTFGGLGQDDIIGGSSDLYGLTARSQRPDGSDLIFGGAGTEISPNNPGQATVDAHGNITVIPGGDALDSDTIIGDNGRILRLVGVNGTPRTGASATLAWNQPGSNGVASINGLLVYNYDNNNDKVINTNNHIVVRAVDELDYTPGGPDNNPTAAKLDIGGADEIHGEGGDDFIYGMKGNDVLFGDGQNDSIIGGYGNDSISGGTGDDGIIGDDGRISISRNSLSADPSSVGYLVSTGEPLNGIPPLLPSDLNKTTNLSGALKVTFNLTPDNVRGTDSAIFAGTRSAYTLTDLGGGSALVSGPNGNDTLASVERLIFDDQTVIWPPEPDLIVSSITPAVTSVAQGSNLSFSYVIKNQGGVGAGLNYSSWLVDSKPTVGSGSVWDTINSLAAGATASFTDSISTSGLSVGTHTLWVDADNWNNVAESTETNNWNSVTFTVTAPPQPDLIVSSITPAVSSVAQGTNLSFSYVIKNQGTAAAGLNYSSWLVDSKPTVGSGSVWDTINSLAVGATASFTDSISTSGLSVGTHTLWVDADNWNNVAESTETNNWNSVTFTVTAPPQPDLIVSSITPAVSSVAQGTNLSFSYVIKNQGTAAAGLNYSSWLVDSKPTVGSGSVWDTINSLAAGATASFTDSISTSGLSVGTHTLWVDADNWNNVAESTETNNWNSVTFTVTAPPHPQAAASAPSQPDASNPLTADALAPTFAAAKELWTQALGAGDPRLAILDQVKILISSLPDRLLGATTGTTIVLDSTAAGWGWFVDPTPLANSEFGIALSNGVYAATPGSPAYGHMDLLTTLIHELGNAMGFAEDQGQDVTGATLQAGVRRIPTVAAASPLPAADPPVTVPVASNLPAPNASNGFAAAQPASAGSPLTKGSLGQPIIPVAVAPAALTPGGAPAGVVVASAPVLPGIAPSWGLRSAAQCPRRGSPARSAASTRSSRSCLSMRADGA